MVHTHVVDSWTRDSDRAGEAYRIAHLVGGLGAPLFLLLAGVAVVLLAHARWSATGRRQPAIQAVLERGVQIFVLAWLFRLQALLLGWGPLTDLLKVDVLNLMGLAMMATGLLWAISQSRRTRMCVFAAVVVAIAMLTPLVRAWPGLVALPDPLAAYLRPAANYGAFPVFPWAGFLFAGAIIGELTTAARGTATVARMQMATLAVAAGGVMLAWWLSFRPAIVPHSEFWHGSPTFFFIRLAIIAALVPLAWLHYRFWVDGAVPPALPVPAPIRRIALGLTSAVQTIGRSSLFVYWVHVEMVYGILVNPIKRALPFELASALGFALLAALYGLVLLKNRLMRGVVLPRPVRIFEPVLK